MILRLVPIKFETLTASNAQRLPVGWEFILFFKLCKGNII